MYQDSLQRRSYNIDSIAVGVTENPEISSMTIVLKGDDAVVDQVKKQLLKLPRFKGNRPILHGSHYKRISSLKELRQKDSNHTEIISLCGSL